VNQLPPEKRAQILRLLVEGNSLRAISRIVDCSINTVTKLLVSVGKACAEYQDRILRNLPCKRIQVDEIWSFVYSKQKNVPQEKQGEFGIGDVWTWVALCPDTKLAVSWMVGDRSQGTADSFMADLASRLRYRIQLSTDGYTAYPGAVEKAFGAGVDYGAVMKVFRAGRAGSRSRKASIRPSTPDAPPHTEHRYSQPDTCTLIQKTAIMGHPKKEHLSTSLVERQNLTMRMCMRRFTRLTNAFSKKVENHVYAVALHFMYYNFVRIHCSIRVTPAMEAGVTNRLWELEELLGLPGGGPIKDWDRS